MNLPEKILRRKKTDVIHRPVGDYDQCERIRRSGSSLIQMRVKADRDLWVVSKPCALCFTEEEYHGLLHFVGYSLDDARPFAFVRNRRRYGPTADETRGEGPVASAR